MTGRLSALLLLALSIHLLKADASEITTIAGLDPASIRAIELQLTKGAEQYVSQHFPGHPGQAVSSFTLIRESNVVKVDLKTSVFDAVTGPGELEQHLHQLHTFIYELLRVSVETKWIEITIGNKTLYENFPENF